jgi:hypothetical protein
MIWETYRLNAEIRQPGRNGDAIHPAVLEKSRALKPENELCCWVFPSSVRDRFLGRSKFDELERNLARRRSDGICFRDRKLATGPAAMPPAAAVPQNIAQAPPPPPPPGGAGYWTPPTPPPLRRGRGPGGPPPPPPQATASTTTVQGTVRSLSYGPAGDMNGVILEQGTEVHVPPDQANQLNSLAPIGTRIQVSGWTHTGPLGDTHLDATTITNPNSRATMTFPTPPPPPGPGALPPGPPAPNAAGAPPPPPPAPPAMAPQPGTVSSDPGTDTTITGVVRSCNNGPAGEVNGPTVL